MTKANPVPVRILLHLTAVGCLVLAWFCLKVGHIDGVTLVVAASYVLLSITAGMSHVWSSPERESTSSAFRAYYAICCATLILTVVGRFFLRWT